MRCTLCLDLDDWSAIRCWILRHTGFPEAFTRTDGRVGRYRAATVGSRPVGLRTRRFKAGASFWVQRCDQDDGYTCWLGAVAGAFGAPAKRKVV